LNPIINSMDSHPRPHQQTTPDPLAEPVAIFVEGMDFTPPNSEQPSGEFSADSENTPTDQQQNTNPIPTRYLSYRTSGLGAWPKIIVL
jgi:hypothetical protein